MKRLLDPDSLRALSRGSAILGAGGGGDAHVTLLQALQATEDFGPVPLVDLDELPDDALIMPVAGIGATTVILEKFENGDEGVRLLEQLEFVTGRSVAALIGLPVVDADGIGRSFPEIPQVTMYLAGISASPAVLTDERGNMAVFRTISGDWMERLERAAAVEFGGSASGAGFSLTAAEARSATIRGSVSKAIRIGEALAGAASSPVAALMAEMGAFQLITGKVMDVERHTTSGFVRGSVVIEGLDEDAGRLIRLELQNENLVALERGRVRASVPDLITVVDSETADAIASEVLRYGQRVTVIAFACDPVWRTERGIAVAGPRAFGYDFDYLPVEELAGATT